MEVRAGVDWKLTRHCVMNGMKDGTPFVSVNEKINKCSKGDDEMSIENIGSHVRRNGLGMRSDLVSCLELLFFFC